MIKNRPMKKESYARSACTRTTKNSSKTHSPPEGYIIERKKGRRAHKRIHRSNVSDRHDMHR